MTTLRNLKKLIYKENLENYAISKHPSYNILRIISE